MSENDGLRRYIEAGILLTQITRARAEELVRELVQTGEVERTRAQDWAEDLVRRSRETSEVFIAAVRNEVEQQLKEHGISDIDELARHVAAILEGLPRSVRASTAGTKPPAGSAKPSAKKTAPKRAGAKKTGPKKAAAKKDAPKKSGAAKSGAGKAAAKRSVAKKSNAEKTAAKKSPAKKSPAKRTGST
ncbi:MAG TPA: hypothetical protein VEJ87_10265 [Acidimicrobiales bacterium]|nr:hypothetical protein [Acidimicrobiales bacterium]